MSQANITNPDLKPWKQPGYDAKADELNSYGYVPTIWLNVVFLALFALLTVAHAVQCFIGRRWFMLVMVVGGFGEALGWGARLWSSYSLYNDDAFMMQICTLIFAPSFFTAAIFAIAGWIVVAIDSSLSWLNPRYYWRIFVVADVISLVIQSGGGGIAASSDSQSTSDMGSNIMLAGIIFQLIIVLVYIALFGHFLRNVYQRDVRPSRNLEILIAGSLFATLAILIRGIYRVVELAEGWGGYLITTEPYFVLDAAPMVICMLALSVTHPHWTLRKAAPADVHGTPLHKAAHLSHMPLDSTSSGFPLTAGHKQQPQMEQV